MMVNEDYFLRTFQEKQFCAASGRKNKNAFDGKVERRLGQFSNVPIGVFGGSGLYQFLENVEHHQIDTPYGAASDKVAFGTYNGKQIAFLPRHGAKHQLPPHKINFRANVWAMKFLGVKYIISPAAAGSLQRHIKPGDFVVPDQFIDRTTGRGDTFYDGAPVTHMPGAEPMCGELRTMAVDALKQHQLPYHDGGATVVIQGPRFSTKAESKWFTKMGWDLVNMTLYPEAILCREQEMAYVNISLITDYDTGFDGEFPPVEAKEAVKIFMENTEKLKQAVFSIIDTIDTNSTCSCHSALQTARW